MKKQNELGRIMNRKDFREANDTVIRKLLIERDMYKPKEEEPSNFFPIFWLFISTLLFIYAFISEKWFSLAGAFFFFALALLFNQDKEGLKDNDRI